MEKLSGGFITYEKQTDNIVVMYAKNDELKFHYEILIKNAKTVKNLDDYKLLKAFSEKTDTSKKYYINEALKGMKYSVKSLMEGKQFEFAVDYKKGLTHIIMPSLDSRKEKWVETSPTTNALYFFSNALITFNIERNKQEINNLASEDELCL